MPIGDMGFNGRYMTAFCSSCMGGAHFCKGTTLSGKPCECHNTLCELERSNLKSRKALGYGLNIGSKIAIGVGKGIWKASDPKIWFPNNPKIKAKIEQEKQEAEKSKKEPVNYVNHEQQIDNALNILRERYAKGEITKEQLDEMLTNLGLK